MLKELNSHGMGGSNLQNTIEKILKGKPRRGDIGSKTT